MMNRALVLVVALAGAAGPARAWLAGVEGTVCTLEHTAPDGAVRLTYDPSGPVYSLSIRRAVPWPQAPVFAIRFDGARSLTISTRRHVLSDADRALSVLDRGFGNVLDGLEFNAVASAIAGDTVVTLDLTGAAPEVAAFRACSTMPTA